MDAYYDAFTLLTGVGAFAAFVALMVNTCARAHGDDGDDREAPR
jgi:hypothetical protein